LRYGQVLRIVLDTNIIVSRAIKKNDDSDKLFAALKNRKIALVISYSILEEIIDVLSRPRIIKFTKMGKNHIKQLAALLLDRAIITEPQQKITICRDHADNKFIEAAISGRAEYIVSGDKDLLDLQKHKTIKIISLKEFVTIL